MESTTDTVPTAPKPPRKKKRAGEFRYQVKAGDVWRDSEQSYKGPVEALEAAGSSELRDTVVRAIRVASPEYVIEAVTKTALKKRV